MRCQKSRRLCAQRSGEVRPCPFSAVLHAQEVEEHENKHRICHVLPEAPGRALAKANAHVALPSSWLCAAGSLLISHSFCQSSAGCICISLGAATVFFL